MEIWQSAFLGFIQGLTEFLPVSSSGHIALFQRIFGLSGFNSSLLFTLILHLGTLVAVCIAFRKDIAGLFKKPFKVLWLLVLATVPAGLAGIAFKLFNADNFLTGSFAGIILAINFAVTAALLFVTDISSKKDNGSLPLSAGIACTMGMAQSVAVLPGISRSGATICAGTLSGCKTEEVAKFSFLMSIPVILGSFAVELISGLKSGELQKTFICGGASVCWCAVIGFVTSALAGALAINVMLNAIRKANYKWFSLYLVGMAILSLVLNFTLFNNQI